MTTISCTAAPGTGGLGRHFTELLDDLRERGELTRYYSSATRAGDEGVVVRRRLASVVGRYTPVRLSAGWKVFADSDLFDRAIASQLCATDAHVGFGGQSLRTFRRARALAAQRLELVSGSSHVDNVRRRHADAARAYGFEGDWLNGALHRKTLAEYELVDSIVVASEYSRESFLAAGVAAEKVRTFAFRPDPRYVPPDVRPADGVFRVVYVGALTVAKGVPVLVDAFARWREPDAELVLVGGWATRGMRRYLEAATARDARVRIVPGDPLPHLQRADVYVHPSFQDGFAYAPLEALACGVPVVVSEDTGMKERVRDGLDGYVVPTGDGDAILDRLVELRERPLVRNRESALL